MPTEIPINTKSDQELRIEQLEESVDLWRGMAKGMRENRDEFRDIARSLKAENDRLKAELENITTNDPFLPQFEERQEAWWPPIAEEAAELLYWDSGSKMHKGYHSKGRLFSSKEKAEEFARVEQTRFKLETLAAKTGVKPIYMMKRAQDVLDPKKTCLWPPIIEAFESIGEDAIKELLEWSR